MNTDFYATSAQVIPVLLLTLTLGDKFLLHHLTTRQSFDQVPTTKRATIPMFGVIVYLVFAEWLALYALMSESDTAALRIGVVIGLTLGLTGVAVAMVARMWEEVTGAALRERAQRGDD